MGGGSSAVCHVARAEDNAPLSASLAMVCALALALVGQMFECFFVVQMSVAGGVEERTRCSDARQGPVGALFLKRATHTTRDACSTRFDALDEPEFVSLRLPVRICRARFYMTGGHSALSQACAMLFGRPGDLSVALAEKHFTNCDPFTGRLAQGYLLA
jgi:hypothetical protein